MNDDDLRQVLDRATAGIGTPVLAARAYRSARRRRTRRRGAAAALLSSGLVVAVVVASQIGSSTSVTPPPTAPSFTPTPLPTDGPSVVQTDEGPWDPREVDSLPAADPGIAPTLPDVIDPPDSSPLVTDEPIEAAVLAVVQEDVIQVLGIDGSWRSVAAELASVPSRLEEPASARAVLSPQGTRLAVFYYADSDLGATIYDLGTGTRQVVPFPDGFAPWEFTTWEFPDEDTLLLDDNGGGFLIDLDSGTADRVPFPTGFDWALDPAGVVVETSDVAGALGVTDWSSGAARTVDRPRGLEGLHAGGDLVAGTSNDGRPFSVVVADRATLTPQATLRVRDFEANYSNGGLRVLALAEDGTVLLRVSALARGAEAGTRVVAWNPETGQLSLVSSKSGFGLTAVAEGLLGSTSNAEPDQSSAGELWDQRQLDDLPAADRAIAPGLPDVIDPPASSPLLSDEPVEAAVLAVEQDDVVQVLGIGGEWRTVPSAESFPGVWLSPGGTRLVLSYFGGDRGATVYDLATGESREILFPDGYQPFDGTVWTFADDETLFLGGGDDNNFLIDATTGEAERLSHGATVFDPDGAAIEADCCAGPLVLRDWAGGETRDVSLDGLGRLDSLAVSTDRVAGASYDSGDRVIRIADRATLTPSAELRARDYSSSFGGNGGFSVLALAEDGTVILRVARIGRAGEGFGVVAWASASGELSLVSSNPVTRSVVFADDYLRGQP